MKQWRSRAPRRKEPDLAKAIAYILVIPLLPIIIVAWLFGLLDGRKRK